MITKLHDTLQPQTYDLSLTIDRDSMQFQGSVLIHAHLSHESKSIDLHAKSLVISSAFVNDIEAQVIKPSPDDVLTLQLKNLLQIGECEIKLNFAGDITDDMVGMYPCHFQHEGHEQKLIATQFESHHAREVFPCIDEPAAKATFRLTLITPTDEPVLSNMPISTQMKVTRNSNGDELATPYFSTSFETTPKMSTYLLAFVYGNMHHKEVTTNSGVLVRSWATIAQPLTHLTHSLNEAVKIIEFYDEYFDIAYPLKKCDQVALPDFDAGAMENWGLITYRETALLTDPQNHSLGSEQYISIVVAHELSHQWFGNLVTMQWWDDLWLNESFASLMEYIAIDALHPEWLIWEDYTASDVIVASNRDVYEDVQPVRVDVDDPAQISTLFDGAIVYAKGGRLLKMLREFIGEEYFKKGLKQYFVEHAYSNTTRDDLWKALQEASNIDVPALMNSWLEQSGMPLITLLQDGKSLFATQQRLLLDNTKPSSQLWQIPLLSESSLSPDILTLKQATLHTESDAFVLLNSNASGHYVVQYESPKQREQLEIQVKEQNISPAGRINTFNDMILLAKAGKMHLNEALNLVSQCKAEPRDSVWGLMSAIIGNSRMLIEGNKPAESQLKQFTYNLSSSWYKELGWDFSTTDDSNTTHLRRTILGLALSSENQAIIDAALARFDDKNTEDMNAEIRSLLLSAQVRFGTTNIIEDLITLYKDTQLPDLQNDICVALTNTKELQVAQRLTHILTDKNIVRPQDIIRWIAYLLRNRYTREVAWAWMESNWPWLTKTFSSSKSYDAFPRYGASFSNSEIWLKKYREFFLPKRSDLALRRNIDIGIHEITARIAWRKRDEKLMVEWLSQQIM